MTPTQRAGRDGRELVATELAAYSLGKTPKQFRDWARRRSVKPAAFWRPSGRRGQALALWDLADITDVLRGPSGAA